VILPPFGECLADRITAQLAEWRAVPNWTARSSDIQL
jgi:hypothetical protein